MLYHVRLPLVASKLLESYLNHCEDKSLKVRKLKSVCVLEFLKVLVLFSVVDSIGDPDPQDPHVFGPSGSGSIVREHKFKQKI